MEKKYRLQIDFSEKAYRELNELQERLDAQSKSEVIRNALGVLRWVIEESMNGHRILVEKPEGTREIVFHFVERQKDVAPSSETVAD
jgi:metal-responsive CopG/Arc/MetJ family transcriptional regulator